MIRAQIRKFQTSVLVLVVDSDADTRTGLSQSIRNLGHNCQAVASAASVRSHLQSSFPDLVLMDLLLPDSDARQLIQLIRQGAPHARIVVMVRPGSDASIREALSWGASDFLEKPVHELRLACLLGHLQSGMIQTATNAQNAACLPNVFFNDDTAAYQIAKSRFQKASDMHIPLLIEGGPGTGKTTLARHFSSINAPARTVLQWNAATDDFEAFRQSLALQHDAGPGRTHILLFKHVEAASLITQRIVADYIRSSAHTIIATTRGRLLDHAKNGFVDATLYNVLSPLPIWLAPLQQRSRAYDDLSRQSLAQANACFGSSIQKLQYTSIPDHTARFADNISGLKRAVFKAVADHTSPISPAIIQAPNTDNYGISIKLGKAETVDQQADGQQNFAMVPLLDNKGKLRTLKALEQDALLFAYKHQNARVGKIAKALKLGRTTLYRKLLEMGLVNGTGAQNLEENKIIIQPNQLLEVESAEKYAA
ncbi:response regulator [Pararhizobium sp. IMCC21322]|uniref:response regulator n=1 Tax=Pararhizobium sp. IMCC21322 TaxID=3067903 RepID=UPI0027428B7B|nr:response regulator [Pararhizobium sp. IMCC21322]